MFALMMSEDRISMQGRRNDIIEGMKQLPGELTYPDKKCWLDEYLKGFLGRA